jgi:hypothetical protein
MVIYEQLLDADPSWAMNEGGKHFEERSAVQIALRKIAQRMHDLHIPYAVAGGMALFAHGFRRFTEDVDILVSSEGLKTIHRELAGLGYRPPFEGSKNLRDVESGVRIEFLVAGQFPGDGKAKPVAFPQPDGVLFEHDGINFLNLPTLVELKLASGMTNENRVKDLADVQELIKLLSLDRDFENSLNPYVREKYRQLWAGTRTTPKRYLAIVSNEFLQPGVQTMTQMLDALRTAGDGEAVTRLEAMQAEGVTLENPPSGTHGRAYFVTTDPAVAAKYELHDETEFLSEE